MNSFMRKKGLFLCIFFIILLAFFLRFYNITVNPPGIHADEADSGYNAYSILKTGKDFYGNFLPLQITGFASNYRAPLSTYVTIPSVAFFGLNNMAIRLPAVILGTLLPILIFFLLRELFKSDTISIVGSFLTAVNPWAVHISRAYADHILALDLGLLGIIFFLKSNKNIRYVIISSLAFGFSLFSYHAPKIFLPIFIPILAVFQGKILKNKINTFLLILIFGLFFLGVVYFSLFSKGSAELNNVSIINNSVATKIVDRERRVTYAPLFISSILHNKPLFFIKSIAQNLSKSLSVDYLYLNGEADYTAWIGDRGLFYPSELPFFLFGLYFLARKEKNKLIFFTLWILASVVPGAITNNQMYTYRNIFLLPAMICITSYGLINFLSSLNKNLRKYSILAISLLFLLSTVAFYIHYYFDYPVYSTKWWAAEQHEAIEYATVNEAKYAHVYIDGGADWPLLFAYYNKVDPSSFQKTIRNYAQNNNKYIIGKFSFGDFKIDQNSIPERVFAKDSLVVVSGDKFPKIYGKQRIISKEDWGVVYKIIEVL